MNVDIRYSIEVEVTRSSMFGTTLKGEEEFIVETPTQGAPPAADGIEFTITPGELANVKRTSVEKLPGALRWSSFSRQCDSFASFAAFKITGQLHATNACLRAPFTGQIVVEESEAPIRSIELQLVRVETTGAFQCIERARCCLTASARCTHSGGREDNTGCNRDPKLASG